VISHRKIDAGIDARVYFSTGLFGAIQSAISSVLNASSAVFTSDIYNENLHPKTSQPSEIRMGKLMELQ